MKKERMTVEELTELLKQNPDGVELVCDDGLYCKQYSKVITKFIHNGATLIIDNSDCIGLLLASELIHYPSQKPQRELIELFECLDNVGESRYCDKDGRFPYRINKEVRGIPELCEIRKNSIIKGGRKLYRDAVTYELEQDGE